jgi:hypothetical protein
MGRGKEESNILTAFLGWKLLPQLIPRALNALREAVRLVRNDGDVVADFGGFDVLVFAGHLTIAQYF